MEPSKAASFHRAGGFGFVIEFVAQLKFQA